MADLTPDQHDEAFHEIHLSGKQLVFLLMATTVISVVIFLCGVAVGRSIQGDRFGAATGVLAAQAGAETADDAEPAPPEPIAGGEPGPPPESSTRYVERLTGEPGSERPPLRRDPPAEASPPANDEPAPRPERAARVASAEADTGARPGTWAVQVSSLRNREAAERIVRRLRAKDYPAYLVEPEAGVPGQLYKVQVGRYPDRGEAQKVEARLKEERFETWIVR